MLPGLTAWTLFPNSYHKKDFVLALLSGRSRLLIGSWYWVRGIHSIRIFPSQMAFLYIYNTCGNQSWSVTEKVWGWVGYIPTNNSIDFLARQKRACDLTGFSILPPFARCCLTWLIDTFSPRKTQCLVSIATYYSNSDCSSPSGLVIIYREGG